MFRSFLCSKDKQHVNCMLFALWVIGFVFGCYIGSSVSEPLFLLMRTSLNERVSIVRLLIANSFPVLLVALALRIRSPLLINTLLFIKAFVFGYALLCVMGTFCGAAWLMFLILFIPVFLDNAVWLIYALNCRELEGRSRACCLVCVSLLLLAFNVMDYLTVTPFVAELLY